MLDKVIQIIEWQCADGTCKIGIIDCRLRGKENPVVDYLKTKTDIYKEVQFLILTST